MKSNHNKLFTVSSVAKAVINMSKIQNEIKSQHIFHTIYLFNAVINMSKIQNEIKSQQLPECQTNLMSCYQYVKDTK